MRYRLLIGAAIFCSLISPAFASERTGDWENASSQSVVVSDLISQADLPTAITLEQAFQIADQSNRDIEQAVISIRQAEAAPREQQAD